MNKEIWVEVFGIYYLRKLSDENHSKILRMDGNLFIRSDYLEEL